MSGIDRTASTSYVVLPPGMPVVATTPARTPCCNKQVGPVAENAMVTTGVLSSLLVFFMWVGAWGSIDTIIEIVTDAPLYQLGMYASVLTLASVWLWIHLAYLKEIEPPVTNIEALEYMRRLFCLAIGTCLASTEEEVKNRSDTDPVSSTQNDESMPQKQTTSEDVTRSAVEQSEIQSGLKYPDNQPLQQLSYSIIEILEREEAFAGELKELVSRIMSIGKDAARASTDLLILAALTDLAKRITEHEKTLENFDGVISEMININIAHLGKVVGSDDNSVEGNGGTG